MPWSQCNSIANGRAVHYTSAGLLFASLFICMGGVPVVKNGAAESASGQTTDNRGGAFVTTHWSIVLTAQGESAAAQEALERLCRIYWWPIYSFIRRQGSGPEETEDLTQGFFAVLLERKDLQAVRRENGRLRSFFFASLKHFLAKEHRRATAVKRGDGPRIIPLDELLARRQIDLEPADKLSADKVFDRRWALTVLERAMTRLEHEYRTAGNARLFERLRKLLTDEPDPPSRSEIAHELGMTENGVNQGFYRLRQRYRESIRDEIAQTVIAPTDTEDELRHLVAALRP